MLNVVIKQTMSRIVSLKGKKFRMTKKSQSINKVVKRIVRNQAESKFRDIVDTDSSFVVSDSSLIQADLLHIDEGDGVGNREGRKIMLKGIHIKAHFESGNTSAAANMYFRMLVLRLPNNVGLGSDSLNTALANGTFTATSFYPRDTDRIYNVLYDKIFTIQGAQSATGGLPITNKFMDKYIKVNKPVYYDGATGSTDLQRGDMVVLLMTEATVASALRFTMNTRVHWKDL